MANNVNDPQWRQLIPADIQSRIQSVIGIKDADRDSPHWVIYLQLDGGERYSGVYTPATNGYASTISSSAEACENDLQRKQVAGRVGLVQQAMATRTR